MNSILRTSLVILVISFSLLVNCTDNGELSNPINANRFSAQLSVANDTINFSSLEDAVDLMSPVGFRKGKLGSFDATLLDFLQISICEDQGDDNCLAMRTFDARARGVGLDSVALLNKQYHVNWKVSPDEIDRDLMIEISVANLLLKKVSYLVSSDRAVPIKLAIGNHPRIRARVLHEQGFNATAIADSLVKEFASNGAEIAYVLYEEQFGPVEIGDALRDVFSASAAQVASWMKTGGMDANFVAEAMKGSFQCTDEEMAVALKIAGFSAPEIYGALKAVYDFKADILADIYRAEDILIYAGFSDAEALEAVRTDMMILFVALKSSKGPVVYLHSSEAFQMSTVHFFMQNSVLMKDGVNLGMVTPSTLMDVADDGTSNYWFVLNSAARAGEQANSRAYVHVYRLKEYGYTDFQFWLFYPYNGPGTLHSKSLHISRYTEGNLAPMGEHTGDWETVIVRIKNSDNSVEGVFLSHHGKFPYHTDVEYTGDHPIAYSSLNGHGNYHRSGKNKDHLVDGDGWFDVDLLNLCNTGIPFNAYEKSDIIAIDGQMMDDSLAWIGFDGRWGPVNNHWVKPGTISSLIWDTFLVTISIISGVLCAIFCAWLFCLCYPVIFGIITAAAEYAVAFIMPFFITSAGLGIDTNGPQSLENQASGGQSVWVYDTKPGVDLPPFVPGDIEITSPDTVMTVYNEALAEVFSISADSLVVLNEAGYDLCDIADSMGISLESAWSDSEIKRKEIVQGAVTSGRIQQSDADSMNESMDSFDPVAECADRKRTAEYNEIRLE